MSVFQQVSHDLQPARLSAFTRKFHDLTHPHSSSIHHVRDSQAGSKPSNFRHHPQVVRPGLFIAMRLLQPPDRTYSTSKVVFCLICGRYIRWRLETGGGRTEIDFTNDKMSNVSTSQEWKNAKWVWKLAEQSCCGAGGFCLF